MVPGRSNGEGVDAPSAAPVPADRSVRWFWGLRVSALIEIALFLVIALALDATVLDGDRMWNVRPHPFWFIVILVSVQYGANEGLLAAVLASVALIAGNLPEQAFGQDLYDYWIGIGLQPAMWVGAAQLLGQLRGRQIRERDVLRARLGRIEHQTEVITASFDELKRAKAALEARIARQFRTVITTYRAAQAMDVIDKDKLMEGIDDLVVAILAPRKFSLWTLTSSGFVVTRTHGWAADEPLSRELTLDHAVSRHLLGRGLSLSVSRRDDERVLQGQGLLAGALADIDTGEVVGMLKIEDTAFLDFNLYTLENFNVLCTWIGSALVRSRRWQQLERDQISGANAFLLSEEVLNHMVGLLGSLGQRQGFASSVIIIETDDPDGGETAESRTELALAVGEAIRTSFRSSDLAFESQRHDGRFVLLLPGTSVAQTQGMVSKLETAIRRRLSAEHAGRQLAIRVADITDTGAAGPEAARV